MKEAIKNEKLSIRDFLKLLYVFVPMALLLSYYYFTTDYEEKLLQTKGTNTECIVIAYGEGKMGVRGPKKGYMNKCQYYIGDSIHHCYIFTTAKPLPFYEKIKLKYFQLKDGSVKIDFPDTEEEKYKEYGFNDYGY
jgi:hypothetical protein